MVVSGFLDKIRTVNDVYFQQYNIVVVSDLVLLEVDDIFCIVIDIVLDTYEFTWYLFYLVHKFIQVDDIFFIVIEIIIIVSGFLDKIRTVGDVYFQRCNIVVVSPLVLLEADDIFCVVIEIVLDTYEFTWYLFYLVYNFIHLGDIIIGRDHSTE